MKLRISDDLVLGADFVTSTQAIVAKKRVGKTYTAQVEAEELLAAKQQVVVLDPTDAWYGLRSSADGKSPGYPISIFGGRHADLPLEATAGAELADAIVSDKFSAVLSLKLFTKGERLRFAADFLETLYRKNQDAMHLFIDEADAFVPQKTWSPEQARCLGAADEIVRRGGIDGVGITLITQRSAVINKDVLSQIDRLIVLRMNYPLDIKAIKDWIAEHVDVTKAKEMLASLPSLPKGDAWMWSPDTEQFARITVRQKRTFDSGRTPKAGERRVEPKILAPVDLERLGKRIAASVERAKANDPKALRAKIAELVNERDQLARAVNTIPVKGAAKVVEKIVEKVVDRPVLKDGQIARVEKIVASASAVIEGTTARVQRTIDDVQSTCGAALARVEQAVDELRAVLKLASAPPPPAVTKMETKTEAKRPNAAQRQAWDKIVGPYEHGGARDVKPRAANGEHDLKPAHLRILSAIAWWESIGVSEPDFVGVAFVAKTSVKSSSFENNRSRLRAGGYIDYPAAHRMRLTDAGRSLAPPPQIPATSEALQAAVLSQVTPAIGRMLRVLIESYPGEVSFEDLADRAGTSAKSSSFENNRSWIKARGLSTYPRAGFVRATEILFPEAS